MAEKSGLDYELQTKSNAAQESRFEETPQFSNDGVKRFNYAKMIQAYPAESDISQWIIQQT